MSSSLDESKNSATTESESSTTNITNLDLQLSDLRQAGLILYQLAVRGISLLVGREGYIEKYIFYLKRYNE